MSTNRQTSGNAHPRSSRAAFVHRFSFPADPSGGKTTPVNLAVIDLAKNLVLIVDDEVDLASAMAELLHDEGYVAPRATSGTDGLAWIQERVPGAIMLDISLPDMDGLEFLRRLRAGENAAVPVVIITGHETNATEARLKVAGLGRRTIVLRKPFGAVELLKTLKEVIDSAGDG